MYDLRVEEVMRRDVPSIRPRTPFSELADHFLHQRVDVIYGVEDGAFNGAVALQDVKSLLGRRGSEPASGFLHGCPAVRPEMPLAEALPAFLRTGVDQLPVVTEQGELVGELHESDVVAAYHREVLRKDALLSRVEASGVAGRSDFVELPQGHVLRSVDVTGQLVGHSLRELRLPARYGVTVIACSLRDPETGVMSRRAAEADTVLQLGDRIVVVGAVERVDDLADLACDIQLTEV